MLGTLSICYLFFGGVGAGALLVVSLVDLIWAKEPFDQQMDGPSAQAVEPLLRLQASAFLVGFCAVVFGILCLVFDLGRLDRLEALFLNPSPTFLTLGSFVLAALAVAGAFLVAVRFFSLPSVPRGAIIAVEVTTASLAVAAVVYAGMLLQSFGSVALWDTPLVPLLFALSSLSAGCAVLFVAAFFVEADTDVRALHVLRILVRFDVVLVVLEVICAAVFVLLAFGSERESAVAAVQALVSGDGWLATLWWVGFVGCGIVVPLVLEVISVLLGRRDGRTMMAIGALAGVFVLVGALGLRFSVAEAGMHRTLELEAVSSSMLEDAGLVEAPENGSGMILAPASPACFAQHDAALMPVQSATPTQPKVALMASGAAEYNLNNNRDR